MGRRRHNPNLRRVNGILLLDKPAGMTSNAALQTVKKLYAARKAGHTGSLDPLATGLLPLCFGEATKVSGFLLDADKDYQVLCRFGERTSTGDAEGEVVEQRPVDTITEQQLRGVLDEFLGDIEQIPPMYSALKHKGERLYKLARQGVEVCRKGSNQSLPFTGLHFCDNTLVQGDTTDHLYIIVAQADGAFASFPDDGIGFRHNIIEGFAFCQTQAELVCSCGQFLS